MELQAFANHQVQSLPLDGFLREKQLIPTKGVTPEQAAANKAAGLRYVRPRPASAGIVPWSASTLWRKVRAGHFPKPVRLSDGVTAWRVRDVRAWMESPSGAQQPT